MMTPFIERIRKIESIADTIEFSKLLEFVFSSFEAIEKQEYMYNKESLKEVYARRNEHVRYQNLINRFYSDLKESINGHLENLDNIFNPKEDKFVISDYEIPEIVINVMRSLSSDSDDELEVAPTITNKRRSYHYELGKLATKHELFDVFHSILREGFSENELIVEELDHMQQNQYHDIEYYCAFRLLSQEVEKYEEVY